MVKFMMAIVSEMKTGSAYKVIQVLKIIIEIDYLIDQHLVALNTDIKEKNDIISLENEIHLYMYE